MMVPEPSGSTLSYGGETVEGGLGSHCWLTGGSGGCADTFAIILGGEALEAPAGATLSFAYKGKALDSLSVAAYKAGREDGGGGREEDRFLPQSGGRGAKDLGVRRSGRRARIVADLPPGEYVLDVFARMPQGDASYGFRLILEPRDPGGP
jgi:hypothetical protein